MIENSQYKRLWVADAHADTATLLTAEELLSGSDRSHWDFPRFKRYADLQVLAFFIRQKGSAHAAWQRFLRLNAALEQAIALDGEIKILRSADEMLHCADKLILKAIEGLWFLARPNGGIKDLKICFDLGFRSLGLFWNDSNWLGNGAFCRGGLSFAAGDFLAAMAEQGFLLDLAHASDQSFWQAQALWQRPFWVSHTACAAICPHRRNLSDQQLKAVAASGGVVGIAFYPPFLTGSTANLADLCQHLRHAVRIAGIDAVCLGSDFDGIESLPQGMEGVQSLPKLLEALSGQGFSDTELEKIMGLNLRNFFRENLRSRQAWFT